MDTKLNTLIADILHISPEKVTDELAMADVESWDSLQHMNLIASLEQGYRVEFTFDDIIAMQNVKEIKRILGLKDVAV